jgi:hypothetical protein
MNRCVAGRRRNGHQRPAAVQAGPTAAAAIANAHGSHAGAE